MSRWANHIICICLPLSSIHPQAKTKTKQKKIRGGKNVILTNKQQPCYSVNTNNDTKYIITKYIIKIQKIHNQNTPFLTVMRLNFISENGTKRYFSIQWSKQTYLQIFTSSDDSQANYSFSALQHHFITHIRKIKWGLSKKKESDIK